jgi:hypothetical protein
VTSQSVEQLLDAWRRAVRRRDEQRTARARPEQVAEAEHAVHEASAAYRRAQALRLEQLRELNELDIA